LKNLRAPAFEAIAAVIGKKRSERSEKIMIVGKFDFIAILNKHVKFELSKDFNPDGDLEAQEEEENFLTQVSESVGKLGNWVLESYLHHAEIFNNNKELCDYYIYIYQSVLQSAFELFDCDKPNIGRHITDFLCNWVQAHRNLEALEPQQLSIMQRILEVLFYRIKLPNWCDTEIVLEDGYNAETQEEEWLNHRHELKRLFINLCKIKPFKVPLLQQLAA
jgi:hypothetical protein